MNSSPMPESRARRLRRPETAVLFAVADCLFAVAADAVQEIRSTDSLAGSASEISDSPLAKVRHILERGRRSSYVVNAGIHFGLPVTRPALVLLLRQRRVAVLVDRIERMAEIPGVFPLPPAFAGPERRWYRGLTYLEDQIIPVVDPAGFLIEDDLHLLDRAAQPGALRDEPAEAARA